MDDLRSCNIWSITWSYHSLEKPGEKKKLLRCGQSHLSDIGDVGVDWFPSNLELMLVPRVKDVEPSPY